MNFKIINEKIYPISTRRFIHPFYQYDCTFEITLQKLIVHDYEVSINFEFFYDYVAICYLGTKDVKSKTWMKKIDNLIDVKNSSPSLETFVFNRLLDKNRFLLGFYQGI